ncbi:hypothetical protein [Mechercharimyces sp. CAU 1602]|uniref:hypothetical protein n=1 Tax=Mechercharimyces sp. CAU 1602 TaxID=2973933 RepID=UPI0021629B08|nr:hypothetical protein [Mechercharimyces sp. CAU 1602]MCS1352795.1 hypothetical protein [Mechercharimyces sp. CAU 1602]
MKQMILNIATLVIAVVISALYFIEILTGDQFAYSTMMYILVSFSILSLYTSLTYGFKLGMKRVGERLLAIIILPAACLVIPVFMIFLTIKGKSLSW